MSRLVSILLCLCISYKVFAQTETINWMVGGEVYTTTTCESGGDIILPSDPTKYGYTFQGWTGYAPIAYIESTGTQWIDTGYRLQSANVKIEIRFMKLGMDNGSLIGTLNTQADSDWFVFYFTPSYSYYWAVGGGNIGTRDYRGILNTIQDETIETFAPYSTYLINNGASGTWNGSFLVPTSGNIFLFSMPYKPNEKTVSDARIYYVKIYDDDVLVRDMIPVLDYNGVPCMYDKVSQQFIYNSGTGDFIAGPVIK